MLTENSDREQPYALSGHIVILVQLTASTDYSHHCVLISPHPSSSHRINQRGGPSACLSFCPSIRLPV